MSKTELRVFHKVGFTPWCTGKVFQKCIIWALCRPDQALVFHASTVGDN